MYSDVMIGIVLYNPEIDTILKNLKRYEKISKNIFLIDNGSTNVKKIESELQKYHVVFNHENKGIAHALNQLLDIGKKENLKYLLTLDQDSKIDYECFKNLYANKDVDNVAIIAPRINDLNKREMEKISEEYQYVNRCITSGSLMNLRLCNNNEIRFDEKMFIDYVDFDYCKTLELCGYKIIKVRDAILQHEVGKRTKRKFLFWNVYPTNHSPIRVYYFARNIKYYLHKYKRNLSFKEYFHDSIHLWWKFLNILLYEDNKKEKLKMYRKGLKNYKLED